MRVISIINLKGGVGKTFTSTAMAYIMSWKFNKRVLLMDNDKQGNASKTFGCYDENKRSGTAGILTENVSLSEVVRHVDGLDVIDANMSLMAAVYALNRSEDADQYLRYAGICEEAAGQYDYMIIDNPPDIGLNVINALAITDDVIIPVKIDGYALEGMEILIDQIEEAKKINKKIALCGVLVTSYRNDDTNIAGVEWLEDRAVPLFCQKIRYSPKATESTLFNKTIVEYSRRSVATIDYIRFVTEYMQKGDR